MQISTDMIGILLGAVNLIAIVIGFVFYVGRLQQQIVQLVDDHRTLRTDLMKHSEDDTRLFRDINAGLNRLLGRQEAVDTHALMQRLLDASGPPRD